MLFKIYGGLSLHMGNHMFEHCLWDCGITESPLELSRDNCTLHGSVSLFLALLLEESLLRKWQIHMQC